MVTQKLNQPATADKVMEIYIPDSLEKELAHIPNRQKYVVDAVKERLMREQAEHEE
jgi:hypothetical protein